MKFDFQKALEKWERRLRGPEMKFLDTNINASPSINYAFNSIAYLPGIAAGTGFSERVGDRILVKHIMFEGYVLQTPNAAGDYSTNPLRFILVVDRQCNGVVASGTDVFTGAICERLRPNLSNEQRFVVLIDEWVAVNSFSGVSGPMCVPFRFEMDVEIPVEYGANTSASSSILKNSIAWSVTGRNAPSPPQTEIRGYVRVLYVDI